jgi:hypothetical protein
VDVLWAIAEALQHLHLEAAVAQRAHPAVGAVAPARVRLQSQQADRRTFDEPRRHRVVVCGPRLHVQCACVGAGDESGGAVQHRRPRLALVVLNGQQQGGQSAEQFAVLIGHVVANHRTAGGLKPFAHPRARLQGLLAGMEG